MSGYGSENRVNILKKVAGTYSRSDQIREGLRHRPRTLNYQPTRR